MFGNWNTVLGWKYIRLHPFSIFFKIQVSWLVFKVLVWLFNWRLSPLLLYIEVPLRCKVSFSSLMYFVSYSLSKWHFTHTGGKLDTPDSNVVKFIASWTKRRPMNPGDKPQLWEDKISGGLSGLSSASLARNIQLARADKARARDKARADKGWRVWTVPFPL